MISFKRTDSTNTDFLKLVQLLDQELTKIDGEDHAFYNQFNKVDHIKNCVVGYNQKIPISCGAIKKLDENSMEIKRMFTISEARNKGMASEILRELEQWALELKYTRCVLETGKRQPEAIQLYKKNGYKIIPNYGQYIGVDNSVCFEKLIINK